VSAASPGRRWRRPPVFIQSPAWRIAIYVGFAVYLALALGSLDINLQRIYDGAERASRPTSRAAGATSSRASRRA